MKVHKEIDENNDKEIKSEKIHEQQSEFNN